MEKELDHFSIKQTNIAKGIALLLLLWHHLFYNDPAKYNDFKSIILFEGMPIECYFADFCKVCVAVFLILSGYGLEKSFSSFLKKTKQGYVKSSLIYVKNRLIKLLSDFWFVYIVFVPLGLIFGRSFIDVYQNNPVYYLSDFFGVSYFVTGNLDHTMNATWWYMSICIIYYIAFPLIYTLMDKYAETVLALSFVLIFLPFDYIQLTTWLFPFVVGMYFAKYNLFELAANRMDNRINSFLLCSMLVGICALLRHIYFSNSVTIDGFFGLFIIFFSYLIISKIPIMSSVLEELGAYSGLIFMFHTFIFSYYFKEFVYGFKYSILIYVVFVLICYVVARLLKLSQKMIKYDKIIKYLLKENNEKN